MSKQYKIIPGIKPVKTVKLITPKGKVLKDPIRFPKVIEPIEKQFTDNYLSCLNNMTKMIQVNLIKK